MAKWQEAPLVEEPKWMQAPLVEEIAIDDEMQSPYMGEGYAQARSTLPGGEPEGGMQPQRPPYGFAPGMELDKEGFGKGREFSIEGSGLPEIAKSIKEMVSPTTAYTREESDAMASELYDRLSWWKTYAFSLGGRIGPKGLRDELLAEAENFKGFGPALMPSAGKTGSLALEWGVVYPALFKAVGMSGEAIANMPKVKKGAEALLKIGGVSKLIEKYPKTVGVVSNMSKAFGKGAGAGAAIGTAEIIGKDMAPGEIIRHIGSDAALVGGVAATFQAASEVDTALWVKSFRNTILKSHQARFDARIAQVDAMPNGAAKSAAIKSLGSLKKIELQKIDQVVAAAQAQLMGIKQGMYQQGQEMVENPIEAGNRIAKYGLEAGKIYPAGPTAMQKGMGKSKPFIEMPTTRAGEARETVGEAIKAIRHPVKAVRKATMPTMSPSMPPAKVTPPPISEAVDTSGLPPVSKPKPTQPTPTTKITTEMPTTVTPVEALKGKEPVPEVAKGQIVSPAPVGQPPVASVEREAGEMTLEEWQGHADRLQDNIKNKPFIQKRIDEGKRLVFSYEIQNNVWEVSSENRDVRIFPNAKEIRAAKAADADINFADTVEEREAGKQALDDALRPAVMREMAIDDVKRVGPVSHAEAVKAFTERQTGRAETEGEIVTPEVEVESIKAAAYYNPNTGEIGEGRTHAQAIAELKDGLPTEEQKPLQEGFVTNTGRFITNAEATEIAKKAKQLPKDYKLTQEERILGRPTAQNILKQAAAEEKGKGEVAKVYYHGTTGKVAGNIQTKGFEPKITNGQYFGSGVYLTPDKAEAANYGEAVIPISVNLKNPFILDMNKYRSVEDWYDEIQDDIEMPLKDDYGDAITVHTLNLEGGKLSKLKPEAVEAAEAITGYLQEKGHDGVIVRETGKPDEIVVFDPKQVSLAPAEAVEVKKGILPKEKPITIAGTFFHNTDRETAELILEEGFKVEDAATLSEAERGLVEGNLGAGVYLSPDYTENMNQWGGESNLQVKPKRPLKLYSLGSEEGDASITLDKVDKIKEQGYDGIIVNDPHPRSGGYQIVVFDPSLLKIESIVEDTDLSGVELAERKIESEIQAAPAGQETPGLSHAQIVEQAVKEGLPVPAEVLTEYPDLAPAEAKAAPEAKKVEAIEEGKPKWLSEKVRYENEVITESEYLNRLIKDGYFPTDEPKAGLDKYRAEKGDDTFTLSKQEFEYLKKRGEQYEKEETITEPKPSIEEQQRKARPTVSLEPTGELDPTKPEDAAKIIEEHRSFLQSKDKDSRIANSGIYETEWDKEAHDFVITKVKYSHEQVDQAYRTVQTEIESPQDDVSLFAMPGKEKELGAIGAKMAKMKNLSQKKPSLPSIGKARQLPKAKTKKEDFIKAVRVASAKAVSRAYGETLMGVSVEGENLLATDGRRVFIAKGKWGKDGLYNDKASLSKGVLGIADKSGAKFPAWKDILPDYSKEEAITISINAVNNDLPNVWRRLHQVSSMTTEETKGVLVILNKDGSLGFAASAPEVGHTEINVNPGGKILGAANPSFLIDALAFHAIRGDSPIEFYFPYPDRPILTTGPRGDTKTLTMPINVGEPSTELKESLAEEKPKPKGGGAGGSSVAAASAQAGGGGYGTIASSEKTKFAETTNRKRFRDAAPDKNGIKAVDELLKVVSPGTRAGDARRAARLLRKGLGGIKQETVVAHEALKKAHHAFTFMSRADVYDFIDRMETGKAQSSLKLDDMAKSFRTMLDDRRDTVQNLGKGHLENFYENYFPHIWKDPASAKKAIMQIFGKRRLEGAKSFLKKRSIMTIKEGREYGLELVSENPVDLVLLKVYEMDRYIMAQRIIQEYKSRGLIKFVYSRSQSPDGYVKVNDNAFTVYMPPEITKKEAYDQILVDQLMDIARSIGIDTQRFVSIGGKRWGYASWPAGMPGAGPHTVRTKYAGPESVLAHEIGHILGARYDLFATLRRAKDGQYKTVTKGKHEGEQKFVPTKDAVAHRKTIDKEWRDLADARYRGQQVGPGYKGYVRKAEEKEAVLLEALIHAPDEFKDLAPTLHGLFTKFLNNHSELRPILDMKPSLVLGQSDAQIKIPGFTTLGHYYAPEPVGKILNNHLSPGLRNNENKIIASGYNILRMAGNLLNQAQLALSGFHGINVTTDMASSTLGHGLRQMTIKGQRIQGVGRIISTPIAPTMRLWTGIRLRRAYKQQIDTIKDPRLKALVEAVIKANGSDRMDPFYYNQAIRALKSTASDLIHGSPKQKIVGAFKLPFQTFGSALEILAKPLMEWYVPTGKLGLFAMMAESEMKRAEAGQITDEQLHERLVSSWDSVDNRMGQLNYDNLFWNKTFKDLSMLAVRSVGWNLGSWREFGGVPVDMLGTRGRLARGDVILSQKMAYTIGSVILYGTLGAVTGYLLTGKRPEELKDYFFPKTGKKNTDGSAERLSFPTYVKDWFAYATQPVRTVSNKAHPLWGLLDDLVRNEDYFSTQIRGPEDPISRQMLDVAEYVAREFLPLSMRNYEKMSKADPQKSGKNLWVSITGITSAPSYITRSPAQKLMYRYIIENIPDKPKTKEQSELYEYRRNIKNRLRKGDPVDKTEVIKRIGVKSWRQLMADARKEPFIESFSRLSLTQALNVYAIASPTEKQAARTVLKGKYSRAEKITPEMKQLYNELLQGAD